jgi:hypothetical protein
MRCLMVIYYYYCYYNVLGDAAVSKDGSRAREAGGVGELYMYTVLCTT